MTKTVKKAKVRKMLSRIYYGPPGNMDLYWAVPVSDAKKSVPIPGSLMDAMLGAPGHTIGCHLSHCTMRNKSDFPHPVLLAAFTKSICLIVDKIKNGVPSHAVRYQHGYGELVDLNDEDFDRKKIQENPSLAERTFLLQKPCKNPSRAGDGRPSTRALNPGEKRVVLHRGALDRAVKAGLVNREVAKALKQNN